jgi:hypothetical protein
VAPLAVPHKHAVDYEWRGGRISAVGHAGRLGHVAGQLEPPPRARSAAPSPRVFAGTSEIQRMIISRAVTGLDVR